MSILQTGQPVTPSSNPGKRWLALMVIAFTQLMVALDATIVNVALPTAQKALKFDDAHRAYVVTAYTLCFAGLLLLGGKVGDRFGRRRALSIGVSAFALASGVAGAAPTFEVLVAGRALQGASAALMAPAALALLAATFTDPGERGKAFGVFGAVASSGAMVGLLLGGVLTEYVGWRWCLYVNLIMAAAVLVVGHRTLPRDVGHLVPIDVASGVLATAGLAGLVLACSEAAAEGWFSWQVLAPGVVGVTALAAFLLRQRSLSSPLLPLGILANRGRATAYVATAISVIGTFGMFLMLTYHFQVVLGYSPVRTGLAFLPMTLAVAASSYGIASRLMDRLPARVLVAPGLLVAASGLGLLTLLNPSSGYLTLILPAEVLVGAGIGCVFTPSIGVATSGIDMRQAGVAAATANTAMQIGASLGTALLNTIAVEATRGFDGPPTEALVHGFATATGGAAVALAATGALTAILLRPSAAHTQDQPSVQATRQDVSATPTRTTGGHR
jgi:EmrB/QacA subfamily drug resistance transporter